MPQILLEVIQAQDFILLASFYIYMIFRIWGHFCRLTVFFFEAKEAIPGLKS